MNKFIEYFIQNKRLNYALLFFLAYMGVNTYINIPKEMFPTTELDKISVRGSYTGASASTMDKMAVREIESEIANINGIDKAETTILPGSFTITLSLNESSDKVDILNKVKDSISASSEYLPSDMTEPKAVILDKSKSLIKLSVASNILTRGELTVVASEIKNRLARFKNVSDITIRGDSDKEVSILLDTKAILAYGLNYDSVISAVANLSYIFPIGNIEQSGEFAFVSTLNSNLSVDDYENSILDINSKYITLKDIAEVNIEYPQAKTLSTFNNQTTLTLVISKGENGDSKVLSKELQEHIKKIENSYKDVKFTFYQDSSIPVEKRLNTVISNLMFGLLLVFFSLYILINLRIAFVVTIGIPFSFIIGLLFIYYMGYSINIISLLGALIVIGIVVDDAIVVGENIQRHIDEGMENTQAAIVGVQEMVLPVTLATLTTTAAFLPIFLMKGDMALFLILIPIVVVMILIGSLIESFLFLPLHASELLGKSKEIVNWKPLQNAYERFLGFHIKYKKTFLIVFVVLIPIFTIMTAKSMHFQFFPNFDGNNIYISGKLDINTPIEDTFEITKEIEAEIMRYSKEFALKSTSSTTGFRRSLSGEMETSNNVFYITMELYDRKETNFINRYLNPILNFSFDFDESEKIREKKTFELSPRVSEIIEKYKEKYSMIELGVTEDSPGLIKSDIQINLTGIDDVALEKAIKDIEKKMETIEGIANFSDNINYGKMEYKIKLNPYGESLGLTEVTLSRGLSKYLLDARQSTTFSNQGVMEIKTKALHKDNINTLLNFNISLKDGRYVKLTDVATIVKIRDYEKINKLNGDIVKTVFANVDKHSITPEEVLEKLEPIIQEIEDTGVTVNLLGEKEKNKQLESEMKSSIMIALFLIFISMLFIFSKVKYVLMVMSVIPLSVLGALLGHKLLGIPLTMPSMIGILGLSGVVINDGIIMLDFLHGTRSREEFFTRAKHRLRPILITSITTFLGLLTLIFYATGQAVILQPIAISIGFGLIWGTYLNLVFLPTLYALVNGIGVRK